MVIVLELRNFLLCCILIYNHRHSQVGQTAELVLACCLHCVIRIRLHFEHISTVKLFSLLLSFEGGIGVACVYCRLNRPFFKCLSLASHCLVLELKNIKCKMV